MKSNKTLAITAALCLLLSGCTATEAAVTAPTASAATASPAEAAIATASPVSSVGDGGDMFTERDYSSDYDESSAVSIALNGSSASCDSDSVGISGSTVTISGEGVYVLSGSLDNGMIIVDAESSDKLQLVLNGVSISSESSAPIYISQADKVFLTLATGTENTLSNGGVFTAVDENNIDAVIFSKDDLTINGAGKLTIASPAGHGIVSKDDLVVTGGSFDITASGHGLSGKESVRIADGVFTLSCGVDGIHSENADDFNLGFVYISGGSFDIASDGDGISASETLKIEDGSFSMLTGGGCASVSRSDESGGWDWGSDDTGSSNDASAKGLKAGSALELNGGEFALDCADDGIHSNGDIAINGGSFDISTGDDGIHSDAGVYITAGTINISQSYEGIEGLIIDISGGDFDVTASDDGLNAAGGNDQSGNGGFGFGRNGSFDANADSGISISGGILSIDANGDGIDSNGYLSVSGGETYISGPTNDGNGALDYALSADISGGIFLATGSSGMAMNFGSSSTQGCVLLTVERQSAGTSLSLADSSGKTLLSASPKKDYSAVLISLPEIKEGESYTLTAGSFTTEISLTTLIYGSNGMGGNRGGGFRGDPGDMPDGKGDDMPSGEPPADWQASGKPDGMGRGQGGMGERPE